MTRDVPFNHPAWIEIDLKQFKKNLAIIKNYIGPQVKFCLPVKANAYGHGLIEIARAAAEQNIDYLGVSCLQEGILLRQADVNLPILVFGAIHANQVEELVKYDLDFTISSKYKAQMVADECAKINKPVKVHLELDTGMHRTGVRVDTAGEVLEYLQSNKYFNLEGVYSHLATADNPNNNFALQQINKFTDFLVKYNLINNPKIICHLSNSAGIIYFPQANLNMVRPGLLAFGYFPATHNIPKELQDIKPCFTIKAKVSYFKTVPKGDGISYNHTYTAQQDTHLLTIPLGYGDGLRRSLSNKFSILLNGKRYPIAGNICMDQFMVDIGLDSGYVGDIVTIVGVDQGAELTVQEMSDLCCTIPYEILCGFNNRLPRIYY